MSESRFLKIPVLPVLPVAIVTGCGGAAQPWVRVSDPLVPPVIHEGEQDVGGIADEAMSQILAAQHRRLQRLCEVRSTCDAQHFALHYGSLDACFRMELENMYAVYGGYDLTDAECVNAVVMRNQCLTESTECTSDAYYTHVYQDYMCHNRFQADIDRECLNYEGVYDGLDDY
ncbi:MAG: hypothetical protein KGO50_09210 [Myxococcales bacterium]|nr:hypothetical protein [Myxococcales bacterium]